MHKILTTLFCAAAVSMAASALPSKPFKPQDGKLYDANGNEFVMRGVNYPWAWYSGNEYMVLPAAKRIGCNTVRISLGDGNSLNSSYRKPSTSELENLINLCEQNKLVAIFVFHNETGNNDVSNLEFAANAWGDYTEVLNRHQSTVLVNITNEWYGKWDQLGTWAEAYKSVIPKMRQKGLKNTIVVDAAGWGQCCSSVAVYGGEIVNADPDRNTILSMHYYQDAAKNDFTAQNNVRNALASGATVMIGEIAYRHQGSDVAWQATLDICQEKGVGWLGWSWTGNGGSTSDCDMFGSWDESVYRQNGTYLVKGSNGIAETSKECSVFSSDTPNPDPEPTPGPVDPSGDPEVVATHTVNKGPSSWSEEIEIPAYVFSNASANSIIRLHITQNGQMQFATKRPGWLWTQFNEYVDVYAPKFDIKVSDIPSMGNGVSVADALEGLKFGGLIIKGERFHLDRCELLNPAGISDAFTDAPSEIDWSAPVEIYNLQGMRVSEMAPGQLYIVRQGALTKKVVK